MTSASTSQPGTATTDETSELCHKPPLQKSTNNPMRIELHGRRDQGPEERFDRDDVIVCVEIFVVRGCYLQNELNVIKFEAHVQQNTVNLQERCTCI